MVMEGIYRTLLAHQPLSLLLERLGIYQKEKRSIEPSTCISLAKRRQNPMKFKEQIRNSTMKGHIFDIELFGYC